MLGLEYNRKLETKRSQYLLNTNSPRCLFIKFQRSRNQVAQEVPKEVKTHDRGQCHHTISF